MERILQFGEGNFLRAFMDEYIEDSSFGKVVITQPRTNAKVINALNNQNCNYDIILRGRFNGEVVDKRRKISCVSRCIDSVGQYDELVKCFCSDELEIIISNTTEAGICFEENNFNTFPAKLAKLLTIREKNNKKPLIFIPVELIENNGDELKRCIGLYADKFGLSNEYLSNCSFCNTLVDRIVTGHIEGDIDNCSVACEPYKSFVIQADTDVISRLPKWDVTYTDDLSMYRTRKVRILNGIHTMVVHSALMYGIEIVRDMMNDEVFSKFIDCGLKDIKQTISLPSDNLDEFSLLVKERFNNPFIDHKLRDISLNSVSKFKSRCLDTIYDYYLLNKAFPKALCFSLAALITFYKCDKPNDDELYIEYIKSNDIKSILKNSALWGRDISDMYDIVNKYYMLIQSQGIENSIKEVIDEAYKN